MQRPEARRRGDGEAAMNVSNGPPVDSARSVLRQIDLELSRLDKLEKAAAAQRELLLSARAALTGNGSAGPSLRRPVTQSEVATYLREHPGCSAAEIAEALQAAGTRVSTHLHRGRNTRYESRANGWYLRSRSN